MHIHHPSTPPPTTASRQGRIVGVVCLQGWARSTPRMQPPVELARPLCTVAAYVERVPKKSGSQSSTKGTLVLTLIVATAPSSLDTTVTGVMLCITRCADSDEVAAKAPSNIGEHRKDATSTVSSHGRSYLMIAARVDGIDHSNIANCKHPEQGAYSCATCP